MSKFKVGDFVKGNALADEHYGITNSKMKKARVTYVDKNETKMKLLIAEHEDKSYIGKKYAVTHFECFDLCSPEHLNESSEMKISKIKIGDKIKIKPWSEIRKTLKENCTDSHDRFFSFARMNIYCNRVLCVDGVGLTSKGKYVCAKGWFWSPEWFDVVAEDATCDEALVSETTSSNGKEKIEIEVDLNFPAEAYHKAHLAVEEKIKSYRKFKKEWTKEELQEAQRLAEEMVLELYRKRVSPVFYVRKEFDPDNEEISLNCNFGTPKGYGEFHSSPAGDDIYNETIGRCVCLCKATGRKIPDFILRK